VIRERTPRGLLHFAPTLGVTREARRWAALPNSVRTTLRVLESDPDSCFLELRPRCDLRAGGLRWALYVAFDLGLVEARRSGRRLYYRLSPAGLALLRAGELNIAEGGP
jgi:DNA-binding transcriptional ArsR family regulator